MDFFTFIIIGVVIYSFFSKKGNAPQRRRPGGQTPPRQAPDQAPRQAEPQQSSRPTNKKEGFFERVERQMREAAEAMEKELETGRSGKTTKTTKTPPGNIPDKSRRVPSHKPALEPQAYEGVEGAWGHEGRSDYHRSQSKQGNVIQHGPKSVIEQTSVETGAYAIGSQDESLQKAVGFSSSEIVQGVIWAEILKQPRGMRPYSRR